MKPPFSITIFSYPAEEVVGLKGRLHLDWLAVIAGVGLAALVKWGLITRVPW